MISHLIKQQSCDLMSAISMSVISMTSKQNHIKMSGMSIHTLAFAYQAEKAAWHADMLQVPQLLTGSIVNRLHMDILKCLVCMHRFCKLPNRMIPVHVTASIVTCKV